MTAPAPAARTAGRQPTANWQKSTFTSEELALAHLPSPQANTQETAA
ncbi:hypothetical protein AB0L99_12345 [Streptomyces sp. NPDC051954]